MQLAATASRRRLLLWLQVTVLALGRLYVKLAANTALGQLFLPLLADVLSRSNEASLGISTTGLTIGQAISQTLSIGGAAGASAAGNRAAGQLSAADVAGAVVCALEGMASACVQQDKDTWLYDQALQLLLMMYRDPTPVGGCSPQIHLLLHLAVATSL